MQKAGLNVLVTRPEHQSDNFCRLLEQDDHHAIRLPCMMVKPHELRQHTLSLIKQLDQIHYVIFISENAVKLIPDALSNHLINDKKWKAAAIGKKTANSFHVLGNDREKIIAPSPHNSEALLTLPVFQNLTDKNIILIKGLGGRQLLQQELTARGANLIICEVYQRDQPQYERSLIKSICEHQSIDIIALTSFEIAKHFFSLFGDCAQLRTTPLLVGSPRIAEKLNREKIINPMIISTDPSDQSMLLSLKNWIKN